MELSPRSYRLGRFAFLGNAAAHASASPGSPGPQGAAAARHDTGSSSPADAAGAGAVAGRLVNLAMVLLSAAACVASMLIRGHSLHSPKTCALSS